MHVIIIYIICNYTSFDSLSSDEASMNQILTKLGQSTDPDKCTRNARQLQEFLENTEQRVSKYGYKKEHSQMETANCEDQLCYSYNTSFHYTCSWLFLSFYVDHNTEFPCYY